MIISRACTYLLFCLQSKIPPIYVSLLLQRREGDDDSHKTIYIYLDTVNAWSRKSLYGRQVSQLLVHNTVVQNRQFLRCPQHSRGEIISPIKAQRCRLRSNRVDRKFIYGTKYVTKYALYYFPWLVNTAGDKIKLRIE